LPDREKALRYQQALATFTRILCEAGSPSGVLQNAVAQIARVTHIKHVKVLRYRPDRGDCLIEAGTGWKPGVVGHVSLGIDRYSAPGASLQTGQPVVVEDIRSHPDFRYPEVLREHGIVSVCNVPIFMNGSHWGVLEVDTEDKTSFDEFDVHSLSIFANIIGLSLAQRFAESESVQAAADTVAAKANSELLLRELQHRIKNNLQLIVSFLTLQRRQSDNEETRQRIASVLDRVMAIGLAHDQLSFKKSGSSVDMKEYLSALCANIDPGQPKISISVEVQPARIPLDRAVPVGLVVNELVTNALKYAFDDEGGIVAVTLRADEAIGEAELIVEDNGRGMGDGQAGGFGTKLTKMLAAQLGGTFRYDTVAKGTRVILRFPYSL
jgi:two-component sensor histidine kinase